MRVADQVVVAALVATAAVAAQCSSASRSEPIAPPRIVISIPAQGIDTSGASILPDGKGGVWIVAAPDDAVHRVDVQSGSVANYPLPQNAEAHGAVIEGGALWLADYSNSELLRYDNAGAMKAYPLGPGIFPYGLAIDEGKFLFVEHLKQAVGVMTSEGSVSAMPVPMPSGLGGLMARDDDGALWVGGPAGKGEVGRLAGDGSFQLFGVRGQLFRLFACPNGSVAFAAVDGMGSPWIERIGLMDARGREQHADYVPSSAAASRTPRPGGVAQPASHIVGPPPPPPIEFFGCDAGGAWFVIDRTLVGHVSDSGAVKYFSIDQLSALQTTAPSPPRSAWIALDDRIVELSY